MVNVKFSVRLSPELAHRVTAQAAQRGLPTATFIASLVERGNAAHDFDEHFAALEQSVKNDLRKVVDYVEKLTAAIKK